MSDYDKNNVFSKILNKEIECEKVLEDKNNLSFNDINKQAPIHILTIPKTRAKNLNEFSEKASDEEISSFIKAIINVAKEKGLLESGFRVIINSGKDSHQEVPHLHAHIIGGKPLGPILSK